MNTMTATAAREKGPIIWLDMDQQALDDAYDQAVYAPNRDQLGKRRLAASAAALARIGKPERHAYGPTPIEGLDVYRTPHLSSPASGGGKGGGAPGVMAQRPNSPIWPSRSCILARISSCSISSTSTMPAAACFRWSSR